MGKSGQEALQERFKMIFGRFLDRPGHPWGRPWGAKTSPRAPKWRPRGAQERSKSALEGILCQGLFLDRFFIVFSSILGRFRDRFLAEKCEESVTKNQAIFGVFFVCFTLRVVFSVVA